MCVTSFYNLPLHVFTKAYTELHEELNWQVGLGKMPFRLGLARRDGYQIYPCGEIEVLFNMARKTDKRSNRRLSTFQFINFKFTAKEKEAFHKWLDKGDDTILPTIHSTLQDDVKMSVSWDMDGDCFIVALTGKPDGVNEDKCLTVRSADWHRGVAAIAYIHTVVFKSGLWEDDETNDLI